MFLSVTERGDSKAQRGRVMLYLVALVLFLSCGGNGARTFAYAVGTLPGGRVG